MCLYLKNESTAKVAPYNIICYKRLRFENISDSMGYQYKKRVKQPVVEIIIDKSSETTSTIDQGYHSRNEQSIDHGNELFMIPKDTKFYVGGENNNKTDNYVSETIVFLGNNNRFNRWYYTWKYKLKSYINDKTYQPI